MGALKLLHSLILSNGLSVSIYDSTKLYFGDYYHVRIKIICSLDAVVLEQSHFSPETISLGTRTYTRSLEKMGVPSENVESVKKSLLNDFDRNSLPYISSAGFPKKLIDKELRSQKFPDRNYTGTGC